MSRIISSLPISLLVVLSLSCVSIHSVPIQEFEMATVVVDGSQAGLIWEGFGASAVLIDMFDESSKFGEPMGRIPAGARREILERYYRDLGMTRARFFPQGYEPENDNDDPNVLNPNAFLWHGRGTAKTRSVDPYCDEHLVMGKPFRDENELFVFFPALNMWEDWMRLKSAKGKKKPFDPAMVDEYAEHALAAVLHIKEKYGYELPAWSLFNEPVHTAKPTKETTLALVLAVGRRFEEAGLKTKLTICDDAWPEASAESIGYVLAHYEARNYVGSISYHRYRISLQERSWDMLDAVNQGRPIVAEPVSFHATAAKYGKPLWLTEICNYGGVGLTGDDAGRARTNHIIDEINNGHVSAFDFMLTWGPPKEGKRGPGSDSRLIHMIFDDGVFKEAKVSEWAEWIRHMSRHIRPGDVHIATSSGDPLIKTIAFRSDKDHTLRIVAINNNPRETVARFRLNGIEVSREMGITGERSVSGDYRRQLSSLRTRNGVLEDKLPPISITTYVVPLSAEKAPLIESLALDPSPAALGEEVRITARIWDPSNIVDSVRWFFTESRSPGYELNAGTSVEGVTEWSATFPMHKSNWPGDRHVEVLLFDQDGKVLRREDHGNAIRATARLLKPRQGQSAEPERETQRRSRR
ncbi:hypothetical protein ACFL1X_06930 [Candidatus Hydrogenedentota bacterium]